MLDPIKPIGAFIENTIRPLLEEFKWFFDECDKRGIKLNESNIRSVVDYVARAHFRTVLLGCAQAVLITVVICLTYLLSRS